jgi:hypothetical protein
MLTAFIFFHLPARLHLLHAEFGRLRRRLLDVAGHQVDFGLAQFTRSAPVGHAGRRAVVDEYLQICRAAFQRDVGCEGLAGGAFAQHPVAACTALEIDLPGAVELGLAHRRRLGIDVLVHVFRGHGRAARLVLEFLLAHAGFVGVLFLLVFVCARREIRKRQSNAG